MFFNIFIYCMILYSSSLYYNILYIYYVRCIALNHEGNGYGYGMALGNDTPAN